MYFWNGTRRSFDDQYLILQSYFCTSIFFRTSIFFLIRQSFFGFNLPIINRLPSSYILIISLRQCKTSSHLFTYYDENALSLCLFPRGTKKIRRLHPTLRKTTCLLCLIENNKSSEWRRPWTMQVNCRRKDIDGESRTLRLNTARLLILFACEQFNKDPHGSNRLIYISWKWLKANL